MESCNKDISQICEFYKDKHVLLTGATGFLGKLIMEKLLRVCKPSKIYLIIRSKKSKDPLQRLKELTESQLFHRLKKEDPAFMERLMMVSGDISEPGLGLSSDDAELLMEKVEVVFHGAATVKFIEPLSTATKINVRGTVGILELCKKMKNLESVVHISTAYSHSPRNEIKEEFYDTPITADGLLSLTNNLKPELLNKLTPHIIGEWNNTYMFTKAVAEEAVKKKGLGLPISVVRPAIILTTRSEPIPNWVDFNYGAIGIVVRNYAGVHRVVRFGKEDKADVIPADMTVNWILAVGYETSKLRNLQEIPIYNFTSHPRNTVTWHDMFVLENERTAEIPYSHTYWHHSSIVNVKNNLNYYILAFFLHILPALIIDIGLIFQLKKPRTIKMYNKIHNDMDHTGHFCTKTWSLSVDNTTNLWKSLNNEDKRLFDFDMESLDYKLFLRGTIDGVRLYILKDGDENMEYRKNRYFVVYIIDRILRLIIFSGLLWCLWRIISYVILTLAVFY